MSHQTQFSVPASSLPSFMPLPQIIFNVYLSREGESACRGGAERESETRRDRESQRISPVSTEPDWGARAHEPRDPDRSRNQESNA